MSRKRRRDAPNVDTQLIEIYEDLANEKENVRLKAAHALLSLFAPGNDFSQEKLDKALKRLLRGLCSGRKAARLGFSVALTELLAQNTGPPAPVEASPFLTIDHVVESLQELTRTTGSVDGQEERDHCFGRLFGTEALLKSGKLFVESTGDEYWSLVLNSIIELAKTKTWIREECGWILFNSIAQLREVSKGSDFAKILIAKIVSYDLIRTPEGVALWITCQNTFPTLKMPKHIFHHGDPLHRKEKQTLSRILRENFETDAQTVGDGAKNEPRKATQKGSWIPRLHFAWDVVLSSLLQPNDRRCSFADLWKQAVDEGLFSASSSVQRKSWGFSLFQRYVHDVPASDLPIIFGTNFGRCLVNQSISGERFLHDMANKSLKALLDRASTDTPSATFIIDAILALDPMFDRRTKTKTIEKLVTNAELGTIESIIPSIDVALQKALTDSDQRATILNSQAIADLLVHIVRATKYPDSKEVDSSQHRKVVQSILTLLANQAYGSSINSGKVIEIFKSRITSCLTHISAKDTSDPCYHPLALLRTIRNIPQALPDAEQPVIDTVSRGWRTLEKIEARQQRTETANVLQAFKVSYIFVFLQLYDGNADAVNLLDDLQNSYKSLTNNENGTAGSEMLVEIILSFAGKPSLLYRRLAGQIIGLCSHIIDASGVESMLDVLEAKENSAGQSQLFQEDGASDTEMVDGDVSDAESNSVSAPSEDSTDEEGSGADSEGGSEADGASDGSNDRKLAEILGTRRADEDLAVSDEESSDEDMGDDDMEALDEKLVTFFKNQRQVNEKKKDSKNAKETVVNFKIRVLELLEILVTKEFESPKMLITITPLLNLIRSTTSKAISNRACDIIRTFRKSYKLSASNHMKDESALQLSREILVEVHALAKLEGSNLYWTACSHASLLLVKAILRNGGSIKESLERYAITQEENWNEPASCLQESFVADFKTWYFQARQEHIKSKQ